jgi:hypothetical protein
MVVPLTPWQTDLPTKSSIALLVKYRFGRTHLCERATHHQKGAARQFKAMCEDLSLPTPGERVACQHVAHSARIAPKHDPMSGHD